MKNLPFFILLLFTLESSAQCTWKEVAANSDAIYGLKTDSTLWICGGQGAIPEPQQIGNDDDWTTITVGGSHLLALKSDNSLWGFGNNTYGQTGVTYDPNLDYSQPNQVGTDTWISIAAGQISSAGVKSDGTLWTWGANPYGQLGNGQWSPAAIQSTPLQVGTDTDWKSVSFFGQTVFALKQDNTLWGWGKNAFGELGDGTTVHRNQPVAIAPSSTWLMVKSGQNNSMGIRSDGTLWTWGANHYGQLGNMTTENAVLPQQIMTGDTWISICQGNNYGLALRNDNTLWGFGENMYGNLGNGAFTLEAQSTPLQIGNDINWTKLSHNSVMTSSAIDDEGNLWGWGRNVEQQLLTNVGDKILYPMQNTCSYQLEVYDTDSISLSLYPNPASDTVSVDHSSNLSIDALSITDCNGRIVMISKNKDRDIHIGALQPGIYFVAVTVGGITKIQKLLKT